MTIKVLPRFGNGILSITLILFSTVVGLAQGPWRTVSPEGGVISARAIDPTDPMTVYAGTSGSGMFKTTDGGAIGMLPTTA